LVSHVYPNGAEDIKSHDFFRDIPWTRIHLMAPPFVPRVGANQSITKYFEDEKDILTDDTSSLTSVHWEGKTKKRARDKALRDPSVGRKVMELRKKGAFFGYTYRRPKQIFLKECGRARTGFSRPTILPVG
jgi:hypothetical protein